MKVIIHSEGMEGAHNGDTVEVSNERGAWLVANGYAGSIDPSKPLPAVLMADDPQNPANAGPAPAPQDEAQAPAKAPTKKATAAKKATKKAAPRKRA